MMNTLTAAQVAGYCRVTYNTVVKWIKSEKLKTCKGEDDHIRVNKKDFIEFLETHELPVPPELVEHALKRLLIVDDDAAIVELLKELLSDIEELEIETACNGHEAGVRVESFKPHIVILDLWMPGINGFEVCRHLKYNPETSGIKILVITGYPCEHSMQKIGNIGADHIMEKPLDTEELKRIIQEMACNGKKAKAGAVKQN